MRLRLRVSFRVVVARSAHARRTPDHRRRRVVVARFSICAHMCVRLLRARARKCCVYIKAAIDNANRAQKDERASRERPHAHTMPRTARREINVQHTLIALVPRASRLEVCVVVIRVRACSSRVV